MYETLHDAIASGVVTAQATSGGVMFTGAVNSIFLEPEFEALGAVWVYEKQGFFVAYSEENKETLEALKSKGKAAQAAFAARGKKVGKHGASTFDRQRAIQLRKAANDVREVYADALASSQWKLEETIKMLDAEQDPAEAAELALRRGELEDLISALGDALAEAGRTAEQVVSGRLVECRKVAASVATWQVDNLTGVGFTRFLGDDYMVKALHSKYDRIAWDGIANPALAKKTIRQHIARGVLVGEHPGDIAERITGLFDGSEPGSGYKRAVRIAQTETCRIMSEAVQDTYKAAGDAGIKLRNRWDATLDGHTRPSHRKVDGEVREVGEKFSNGSRRPGDGKPAEAINCRCCLTPVLDGWEPYAPIRLDNITRKPVPYMTYGEWARKYAPDLL